MVRLYHNPAKSQGKKKMLAVARQHFPRAFIFLFENPRQ
jgi:hypothetical protein